MHMTANGVVMNSYFLFFSHMYVQFAFSKLAASWMESDVHLLVLPNPEPRIEAKGNIGHRGQHLEPELVLTRGTQRGIGLAQKLGNQGQVIIAEMIHLI